MKRKNRILIIGGAITATTFLAIFILWSQLNRPATASVHSQTSSATSASWTKLDGKVFTMDHLDDYVAKQNNLSAQSDNYFFVEDGLITKHLAVAVADITGHTLAEEPAYQMRTQTPQTYKLENRTISGQTVPVMMRLDHTEQVAFITRGNKLGTVALTTGDPTNPPLDELNHMIASWTWK